MKWHKTLINITIWDRVQPFSNILRTKRRNKLHGRYAIYS